MHLICFQILQFCKYIYIFLSFNLKFVHIIAIIKLHYSLFAHLVYIKIDYEVEVWTLVKKYNIILLTL